MDFLTLATSIFGVLMSLSWFLQAWQVHKMKTVQELNLYFLLTFWIGTLLWLFYGFAQQDLVVQMSFGVGFIGISVLLTQYFRYK